MPNTSLVLASSLKLIPQCSRWFFFWIILVISLITWVGNILAIRSIFTRKQKCLQKVCIISLALADIFSVTMFAMNNLDTLSRELKIWKLGEFLCYFIPMGQILGTTASSIALLVIALDRYQNVTIAIVSQRWNPNAWKCISVAFVCLLICAGTAYPVYVFFTFIPIKIVYPDGPEPVFEDAFLCAVIEKDKLKLYYIIMAVMVFLPIIVIFIFFYYQIAALVWRHRKPLISTHYSKTTATSKFFVKRTKTVQVQRKIRTFKLVIVLMVAFIACRLPYWIFFLVKLVQTISGSTIWYFHFGFTALNILNCALNPFLYTFLNQTIHAARRCHDFAHKIVLWCCCFTSKDFEELQKNSPFVINCERSKNCVEKERSINNWKIKFVDTAQQHNDSVRFKEQLI